MDESYQDVRELLTNFRSKLSQGDLYVAIEDTVDRFRRQTGMDTELAVGERQGAPLAPDQQLQVLFILQEALSNVRKHSEAARVRVEVEDGAISCSASATTGRATTPRKWPLVARRMWACTSCANARADARRDKTRIAAGQGTRVLLTLPGAERQAA